MFCTNRPLCPHPLSRMAVPPYVAIGTIRAPRYPRYPLVKESPAISKIYTRDNDSLDINMCPQSNFKSKGQPTRFAGLKDIFHNPWLKDIFHNPKHVLKYSQKVIDISLSLCFVFVWFQILTLGQLRFIQQQQRRLCSLFLLTHHLSCCAPAPQLSVRPPPPPPNNLFDPRLKSIWLWDPLWDLGAPQILTLSNGSWQKLEQFGLLATQCLHYFRVISGVQGCSASVVQNWKRPLSIVSLFLCSAAISMRGWGLKWWWWHWTLEDMIIMMTPKYHWRWWWLRWGEGGCV